MVVPVLATDVAAVGEAEAMLLMNQPCEAGREACDSICPMTIPEVTDGTSANVRVGAEAVPPLAAVRVNGEVVPMTVPIVRFCAGELAAMF